MLQGELKTVQVEGKLQLGNIFITELLIINSKTFLKLLIFRHSTEKLIYMRCEGKIF